MSLKLGVLAVCCSLLGCAAVMHRPPKGSEEEMTADQRAAVARIKGKVDGLIVWSSSRLGNHDLFTMHTDGSQLTQLTRGDQVDWYPRFSPDGKQILFTRSKQGWVSEQDSNRPGKWDLYLMPSRGGEPQLAVTDASWGTWIDAGRILYSRGTKVLQRELASGKEEVTADSTAVSGLGGAELQNPHLSPDGRYLAMTLRGAKRETGILALASRTWTKTGEGCQVNWFPSGDRIYWVNPSGNGGSELFAQPVRDGRPVSELGYDQLRYLDLPGQRSHEYFPQIDRSGKWLVWAATRRGHDHDIADYEIYIWEVGSAPGEAARLTFHSGNDRWPDITIPAP
jgi:Tol biopolymer transport system component